MKQRDHEHGVTFTTDDGLDIDVILIGKHDGYQYMAVSTPHKRVELRVSPKGRAIRYWSVGSPITAGMVDHRARQENRDD